LYRLYSTFPDGWYGLGLLLLRAALGATLIVLGSVYLSEHKDLSLGLWAMCIVALSSGALLLVGLVTPIAGVSALVAAASFTLSSLPAPGWNPFSGRLLGFDAISMALATVLLGPGAFSIDAHLFGRRKIIIPRLPAS
jgi:uncharacterized membrane protein YphA (DoxX/SURF4 family)